MQTLDSAVGRPAAGHWRDDPRWAYALVNLSALLWGTNFVLGRLLRDEIGPFTLTAARFTVAAVVFAALVIRRPDLARVPVRRNWLWLFGMAATGVFGFGSLLYSALHFTSATNAALINGTAPLVMGLLAALILRERFTRRGALGALVSFVGVVIIVSGGSVAALVGRHLNGGDLLGGLLALAAVTTWGLYSVFSRIVTRSQSALAATILSTWLGLPLLYPAAAVELHAHPPVLRPAVLLACVYIGLGPSVVAYFAWNESVRRVGPAKVTAFYNLLPVFGSLLGVLVLGEPFAVPQLAGGALVVVGSLAGVWSDLTGSRR
jgi:drug/metabolite transporter (DMT)-like permease